ncbi:PCNA-associated factor [Lamellibrachia satsuma]|nr:PCNA-associated factor [Lamellibrachia satsuma]
MVRTKADNGGRKAVAAKAPRKILGSSASTSGAGPTSPTNNKYGGGNPVCVRPTPEWQKGIGSFLLPKSGQDENTTPTDVTVDVHIHPRAAESATSASSAKEGSNSSGTTSSATIEPSLSICSEPGSSESSQRNGLIDSDSDEN